MADNDLLLIDSSATPTTFAPESTDQGTNAGGKPIRRSMFGMKDGAHVAFGSLADAPVALPTAAGTFMATFRGFWSDFRARFPSALGQKTSAGSLAVVLPSDQVVSTKSTAPTPVASPGYVASLAAKVGPCTAVNIHASNASQAIEGYVVAIDAAAVPAAGAAITPLKKRRLPTNDGTIDGTAEIDTPFAVQNGLVVLLTTSLTAFVPGALTGVIDASTLA